MIPEAQLRLINAKQPSIYCQELAVLIFGYEALKNCCLTGSAKKGKLPQDRVQALICEYYKLL